MNDLKIKFVFLQKESISDILPTLFAILHSNMSVIAPTGNEYDEDFTIWSDGFRRSLEDTGRQVVLIYANGALIGFFQYSINNETFRMEEFQLLKEYHGVGVFQKLYGYLSEVVPGSVKTVEAYAHKNNHKSQGILEHLGLQIVGENKSGNSYHYSGDFREMLKKYNVRERSIQYMADRINNVLISSDPSIYLYGSIVLGDFKLGWSDIDILVITRGSITYDQANRLVNLRQEMLAEEPDNPYYRSFEGGMLSLDSFINKKPNRVVYWGTSGQRITDRYYFDSFSIKVLLENGRLLCGEDVRDQLTMPTYFELRKNIESHLISIRQYAHLSGNSLYSFGWMLDISRCLYTLRTGKIIAKTAAGEWALKESLCPAPDTLDYALTVRQTPWLYKDDEKTLEYSGTINDGVQRYADVLERELHK